MSKKSATPAAGRDRGLGLCPRHKVSARKLNLVAQTIRGKTAERRAQRARLLAAPHRARREEGAAGRHRQRREQPPARRRQALCQGSERRPRLRHAALPRPRPRPRRGDRQVISAISPSSCASARSGRRSRHNGPESQSDRASARHQPHLGYRAGSRGDEYASLLHEDIKLRKFLTDRLQQAGVARIVIERAAKKTRITIHSARPGVVIGKKGADIEKLRLDIAKMTNERGQPQHRRDPQARDRRASSSPTASPSSSSAASPSAAP